MTQPVSGVAVCYVSVEMAQSDTVSLELTHEEALVLFELLCRVDERDALPFEHKAERLVLWDLEAQLERTLVEPFAPNYVDLLRAAREHVCDETE